MKNRPLKLGLLVAILMIATLLAVSCQNPFSQSGTGQNGNAGKVATYSVSGKILYNGNGFPNVTVKLTGVASVTATTDSNGNYSFANLATGDYTVTPVLSGYVFAPKSCTYGVTLVNGNVTMDYVAFSTASTPITYIYNVQGAGHVSPMNGQVVSNLFGVVTNVIAKGFYMQSPIPDNDANTSDGIYVYLNAAPTVSAGDWVFVGGTVSEYTPTTTTGSLSITEIKTPTVTKFSSSNPLPPPVILGNGGRTIPNQIICSETGNVNTSTFNPSVDGIDFYESLEGMLVKVNNPLVVGSSVNFTNSSGVLTSSEAVVVADNGNAASIFSSRGTLSIRQNDYNPERIFISSPTTLPTLTVGDYASGSLQGVVDYNYGNFKIMLSAALPTFTSCNLQRETTTITSGTNKLRVASFNIENFSVNNTATKITDIANTIANRLYCPDIVCILEVEDNDGETNSGTTNADTTLNALVSNIASLGGCTYKYTYVTPQDNSDGGVTGGNIRQAFLYNPARVSFTSYGNATYSSATTLSNDNGKVKISLNPGRIDPTNAAFSTSRKPLIVLFQFNGQDVFLIANHLNSKGGDLPLFGATQPPTLSSETQRMQQAQVINSFVQNMLNIQPTANIILLGDFNDFQFSNPLIALKGTILTNLIETLPESERYTYVYEGNSQAIDHILVSANLMNKSPEVDVVHANAEFPDASRATDHDPVAASFTILPPDTTPPVWSATYPGISGITANSVTLSTKTNETGKAYFVVLPAGSSAPTAIQVKNGQNASGTSVTLKGSVVLTANTAASTVVSGLTSATAYDVYTVAEDAIPNLMAAPTKITVTTLSNEVVVINEGFESVASLAASIGTLWSGNGYVNSNSTYAHAGTRFAGLNATVKWIAAPQVKNAKTLKFWSKTSGTTSNFTVLVQVSTNGTAWTTVSTLSANGSDSGTVKSTYQLYTINLNLTGNYYVRWYMSARSGGSLYVDDVTITGN